MMVETGGWGGIAHYTFNLCAALADAGVEVSLLTNRAWELDGLSGGFAVDRGFAGDAGYVRNVGVLRDRLARSRPDVVHVQSLLSTRFDALLWPMVRRRVPLVMTVHNVRTHERIRWDDWTLWRSFAAADAVIVHTRSAADVARRRLPARVRIELVHHGDAGFLGRGGLRLHDTRTASAPLSSFLGRGGLRLHDMHTASAPLSTPPGGGEPGSAGLRPDERGEARRRLGLPGDGKIVLAFGAIRPYKGLHELIAALAELRRQHADARLVIAGPLLVGTEPEYRDAIRRARLRDAVVFRPQYVPAADVFDYFAAADVAVFNYRDITDSGSLRLACGSGTPVVATAVGSFREFLSDGVTARLVEPGDARALVAALDDVLSHPERAARMADAARALAASTWSWAESAKATAQLYETVGRAGVATRGGRA
jgi:glycosyltransferase involved in cell wall biosynthesis